METLVCIPCVAVDTPVAEVVMAVATAVASVEMLFFIADTPTAALAAEVTMDVDAVLMFVDSVVMLVLVVVASVEKAVDMAVDAVVMAVNVAAADMASSWKEASDSVTMLSNTDATSVSAPEKASTMADLAAVDAAAELVVVSVAAVASSVPQPKRPANQPPTEEAAFLTPSHVVVAQDATSPTAV